MMRRPRYIGTMITRLDHIAIATDDLESAIRRFAEDLGLDFGGREDVPSQQTTTAFLSVPGTRIELITPMAGQGPVAAHLAKRGPGLAHLCFESDDLDADVARLRAKGWQFLSESPVPGAHGTRVIFAHPRSGGGVLIELAEFPRVGHA